jgi:cation transport ATPase
MGASIEGLLRNAKGVQSVSVSPLTGSVVIHYDQRSTTSADVLRSIQNRGYVRPATPLRCEAARPARSLASASRALRQPRAATSLSVQRTVADYAGRYLLQKTLELAIERSLLLLIAAVF